MRSKTILLILPGLLLASSGAAQQGATGSGARAELQQSLQQRYPLTEIGPGVLGLRGGADSIRKVGGTVIVQRPGLLGAGERRQAPANLIRGDEVEAPGAKDGHKINPGERFYVHSVYVGSDVVEFGLLGAQPQATQTGAGRVWAIAVFFFPPEVLHNGDRATVFSALERWLLPEGMSAAVAAAPATYAAPQAPPGVTPTATERPAASARTQLEPGMTRDQVLAALGAPVRDITFEKRAWLVYPGFVVQLENEVVKNVEDGGRPARVRVRSEPEGAEIYLGDKMVGSTPSTLELAAGRYVFIMRLNGYKPWRQEVDVLPGSDITLSGKMEK